MFGEQFTVSWAVRGRLRGNSGILFSRAKISFCSETRTSCFRARKFLSAWKLGHLFARENCLLRRNSHILFSRAKIAFCVETRASCFRAAADFFMYTILSYPSRLTLPARRDGGIVVTTITRERQLDWSLKAGTINNYSTSVRWI